MIRMRLELQKTHFHQLQQKQERLAAEQAEEDSMREQMMAKFACDDRIELMNAQKRRMKQLQHKREGLDLILFHIDSKFTIKSDFNLKPNSQSNSYLPIGAHASPVRGSNARLKRRARSRTPKIWRVW